MTNSSKFLGPQGRPRLWFSHQNAYTQKLLRRQAGALTNQIWALARQPKKEIF